jgi:YebC/PmpR family DNA-binding regulatory protein
MSGHSKWETIRRAKGANDAKRGAVFTKLGNQIALSAKGGTDPALNFALRLAIDAAKAANMPMNTIERAISRAADKSAAQLEEVVYEGYGPGGVAILVECATDNRNRTYPEIKAAFGKNGGAVADPGSVAFQFRHVGMIRVAENSDEAMLDALDKGADDAVQDESGMTLYTDPKQFMQVRNAVADAGLTVQEAALIYDPINKIEINDAETAQKIMKQIDVLDDLGDTVQVYTNFEIAEGLEV